jgi:hypothetical protein
MASTWLMAPTFRLVGSSKKSRKIEAGSRSNRAFTAASPQILSSSRGTGPPARASRFAANGAPARDPGRPTKSVNGRAWAAGRR